MDEPNTLPAQLQAWVARSPNAIALRHKVRDVWRARTWRELHEEVESVAGGLAGLGFERGDAIWIAVDVRPETLIVALAAQSLGGVPVLSEVASAHPNDSNRESPVLPPQPKLAARFAFVRDGAAGRWLTPDGTAAAGVRLIYLETRGSWSAGTEVWTYQALRAHGQQAAGAPPLPAANTDLAVTLVPAAVLRGATRQALIQHTHAGLCAAAQATAARATVGSEHDLYASDLSTDLLVTRVLPLWLGAGLRLNFAEDAATTTDHDRRELGPSLIACNPATLERLRQRVLDNLPVAARTRPWSSWTRRAVREVLGLTRVQTALVAGSVEPLEAEVTQFFAAVGILLRPFEAPQASASLAQNVAQAAAFDHSRAWRPAAAHAINASVTELAPRAREPLLSLEHISLAFNEVKAINDISFAVSPHEVCALIGPNGAGKSSLLNVINGIYRPQHGRVQFAGEVRAAMTPRAAAQAGIARTFQNLAIFKGMTVLENVIVGRNLSVASTWLEQALWLGRARRSEVESRERAEEILEFLHIQRYRHVLAAQLPYGLQKRVELARALVSEPRLLLLDEPMAGMNADEKQELSEFILDVNRELGTTVVLIEHDMRVVMDISDHVVVLDYGRLVGDGTPAEVRQNPDVLRAYLGRKRVA